MGHPVPQHLSLKKSAYKWICAVETYIFKGHLYFTFLKSLRVCCSCSDVRLPPQWVTAAPLLPSSPTKRNFSQGQGWHVIFLYLKKCKEAILFALHFSFDLLSRFPLLSSKTLDRVVCMHCLNFPLLSIELFKLTSISLSSLPTASPVQVSSSSPATLATLLFLKQGRCIVLPSRAFSLALYLEHTSFLTQGLLTLPFKVIAQILPFYWHLLTVTNSAFKSFPSFLKTWCTCPCLPFIVYKVIISSFL